jgi:homoserine O-acetyltransferase
VNYPDAMRGIAAVVTAPALTPERADANVANLMGVLSKNPNWHGGDYYDHGGVEESLIQIRSATLKTYGIETRLRDTMSDPAEIEAAIREEAARWARGFDANSLLILARALRSFDVTAELGKIKAKVLYVLSRTDKLFPPELAPRVMAALKAAGVDADYFLLDSDYGHTASGRDWAKWAPRLRAFMESLG